MRIILLILVIVLILVLFILSPSMHRRRMNLWRGTAFAHRGLHGDDICENTLEAFEGACAAGCGIELDVQLSRDKKLVVFHDDDLLRLTGDARRVDSMDLKELQQMQLPCGGRIPTFQQALERINGRVPLLVELKNGQNNRELCQLTLEQLRGYSGRYIVESFNPLIVMWFRLHAPGIPRGQLVSAQESYMPQFSNTVAWLLSNLCLNFLARPDFVSYDVDFDFPAPRIQKRLFRTPMACWTVQTPQRFAEAMHSGEMPIFEGFKPEQNRT